MTLHHAPIADGPLVIGKLYKVPLVHGVWQRYAARFWPVLGPRHEDGEHIGFVNEHFHIDWRFVEDRIWSIQTRTAYHGDLAPWARPLQVFTDYDTSVVNANIHISRLGWRTCRREAPAALLRKAARKTFLPTLEAAYTCKRLKGMICPHRGADLTSMPVIDGAVTCPLHGLRWNVETGELVRG